MGELKISEAKPMALVI